MSGLHESKYKREDNWGEINGCDDDRYVGTRIAPRPKTYCMQVSMLDTLKVSGDATLSSSLGVGSDASVAGTLSCGRLCFGTIDWGCVGVNASGNIPFPGSSEFAGDLFVGDSGSRSSSAELKVRGKTSVGQELTVGRELTVGGSVTIGNPESRAEEGSNLFVSGKTRLIQDLTVDGVSTLTGRLKASGGITTPDISTGDLKATGSADLNTAVTSGDLTVGEKLSTNTFIFQGLPVQLNTIEVVVGVNFEAKTVRKEKITFVGIVLS